MSNPLPQRIFDLLPIVYRMRDADEAKPLEALMAVLEKQFYALQDDIQNLYNNWFIETCDEWVVPYIGDLLGVHNLNAINSVEFSERPYVANTLFYRRRKGTVVVLERLARDVTGWPAKAVEFFQLLETTQNINHLRLGNFRTPDLRDTNALELLDGPFEQAAHTIEVRGIQNALGRYNIENIGIFLWRLQSYPLSGSSAWPVATPLDGRFAFNAFGLDAPLFNSPEIETQAAHRVGERDVPNELRRRALYDDLTALRATILSGGTPSSVYFGDNPVLSVVLPSGSVKPENIAICDLSQWTSTTVTSLHKDIQVAIDPKLGRLVAAGSPDKVAVSYSYGFSADCGGGPYDRRQPPRLHGDPSPAAPDTVADPNALHGVVLKVPSPGISTISQALAAWHQDPTSPNNKAVIEIQDSQTYTENLAISFTGGIELILQAANKQRPALVGDVTVQGTAGSEELLLDGLLIAGQIHVKSNIGDLTLRHCTVVPGWSLRGGQPVMADGASITVDDTPGSSLSLNLDHTICGRLVLPEEIGTLSVTDSIIDSPFGSGLATLTPALISGNLVPFPALTSPLLSFNVMIGREGPYTVALSSTPTTQSTARDLIQEAITGASNSDAFANARVIVAGNRLAILPGAPVNVIVTALQLDSTATELGLDPANSHTVTALLSGPLSPFPDLISDPPAVALSMRNEITKAISTITASMTSKPTTIPQARDELQAAIRLASADTVFASAIVSRLDSQLVVFPGDSTFTPMFGAAPADSTTYRQLSLESDRYAIAADDIGQAPGPPASIWRSTILGPCYLQSLTLASDSLFTAPILVDRRQIGCVRFSYVAPGSEAPRRYRCQPDLALADITDHAQRSAIKSRVVPSFTSRQYGDPGYAQLSSLTGDEILLGADDGNEMGAFNSLKNAQRRANLSAAIQEYLRFGLQVGFFFET
jgi:hypothetical protein